jgi:hypothetical protein
MTVFVSRTAINEALGVNDEDVSVLYRDVIKRARDMQTRTRMCVLRGDVRQLRWIACDLTAVANSWRNNGHKDKKKIALLVLRAANKIEKAIKRH